LRQRRIRHKAIDMNPSRASKTAEQMALSRAI
jgi:hypothetical protein